MLSGGLRTINKNIFDETKPLLSVITVVFNGVASIERTIKSVINQTYKNIEYIIIDGGSTDGTIDIIKKYEDSISYWQSEQDEGIYYAFNKGIELATGDYIELLNADDWFTEDACQIIADRIISTNSFADVYYGVARVLDKNGEVFDIHGSTIHILNRTSVAHQTCFVSKDIYRSYEYDTQYRSAADYDFICKIYKAGVKFDFVEKIFINYSLGGMSDSLFGQQETYKIKYRYGFISFPNFLIHEISLLLSKMINGKKR